MKKALIVLVVSAFLLGLIVYIGFNFSPYDNTKLTDIATAVGFSDPSILTDNVDDMVAYGLVFSLIDVKVFAVMVILSFAFVVTLVGGIHMLVDKLFYKKFYEEPRIWPAVRRGVIIYLVIFGIMFFRLVGGLMLQNAALIILLGVILELLLSKFFPGNKSAPLDNSNENIMLGKKSAGKGFTDSNN